MILDHRDLRGVFRRLALPLAVQMLGDQLLGVADTIAIGALGTEALAGATAATTVVIALISLVAGFWSGTSILAAQRIGARDVDGFARAVRAGALAPLLAAAVLAIASVPLAGPSIHALVGSLPSAPAAAQYLVLRCISLIPMAISGTLITGLGAAGNRTLGVIVLALINTVHIPLLLVLALGWGTHHPFGIAGAGVSSLLSETIAAIHAAIYVARRPVYRIFSSWAIDATTAMRCAVLGAPESVFMLAVMGPDIAIVRMLAPLGPLAVAGFRALTVVSDLTFVIPSPLQYAMQVVIGQRLGAGDVAGARRFFTRARRAALVVTALEGAAIAVLARPLAFLFTLDARVAASAALPLALHMVTMPVKGWAMASLAPIRAAGDTRFSMLVGILSGLLVLPLVWLALARLHVGLYAVPIAWIVAWSARAAVTDAELARNRWWRRGTLLSTA
jgi:MATE family multidrug resistance protein